MAVEARIRIRHEGCFTGDLPPGASVAQLGDDGDRSVFVASAESPDDLADIVSGLGTTLTRHSVVSTTARVAVVTGGCPPHGLETVIRGYGASIVWPAIFQASGETYTILAPTRARLRQLVERLSEFGAAEIEAVADVNPEALSVSVRLGEVFGALTARQMDVLATAVREGYYASPRATSSERLASGFGVSRATFEEHLRKAEAKVLEGVMATLAAHPVARAALKPSTPAKLRRRGPGNVEA